MTSALYVLRSGKGPLYQAVWTGDGCRAELSTESYHQAVSWLRGIEEPYVETTLDGRRIPPAETGIGIEKPE